MIVKDHYENHLGNFYSWMLGDFEERQKEQENYFTRNCIFPRSNKVALDLGAGNGIQSVSLAKLGFEVKAIDFNTQLTTELANRKAGYNIEVIKGDFTDPAVLAGFSPELVVCMGDTMSHLESVEKLNEFIKTIHAISSPEALFIVSYRDLSKELTGNQRFIPVKSDQGRILTCFLEFFPERVVVTDIWHEYENGQWVQKISSYHKLRLTVDSIRNTFARFNFSLLHMEVIRNRNYMVFGKK
jgi:hypothetical protein